MVPLNGDIGVEPARVILKIEQISLIEEHAWVFAVINGGIGRVIVVYVVLVESLLQLVHSVGHELLHPLTFLVIRAAPVERLPPLFLLGWRGIDELV